MRDRFRTSEDGKASSFEWRQSRRPSVNFARFAPPVLLLLLAAPILAFFYNWGHSLNKRVEHLERELARPRGTDGGVQELRKKIAQLESKLGEIQAEIEKLQSNSSNSAEAEAEEARRVQTLLQSLGFYPYTVDGKPGRKTTQAIKDFQRSEGIEETGEIGDIQFLTRLRERAEKQGIGTAPPG